MRKFSNYSFKGSLSSLAYQSGFLGTYESSLWQDTAPIRQELFSIERLEKHAESLALAQSVSSRPRRVVSLNKRLNDNEKALFRAYGASAREIEQRASFVPAAEWLLDNYHLVEAQIREIRVDLPPGYYRELPKLASGPFAGYPRVFGIAWALVAHTDSHFDPEILRRFINAYQRIQVLSIGELWAIAITLRIVLIENLRRLAEQIEVGRASRADADALVDSILRSGDTRLVLDIDAKNRSKGPLSITFAAQLEKRLRGQDRRESAALAWLENRLELQGISIGEAVEEEQRSRSASNVTIRNIITSIRLISQIDWADWFESVSLVDQRLSTVSTFAEMDFSTRNAYRDAIEILARRSKFSEIEVVEAALNLSQAEIENDPSTENERAQDPGHFLIGKGRDVIENKIGFRASIRLRVERAIRGAGITGYVSALVLTTLAGLLPAVWVLSRYGVEAVPLALFALLGFIPASEIATSLVNRAISFGVSPKILPGLDLDSGIPSSVRTLVAVPTLLTNETEILEQIEKMEVHHLASAEGELYFALVSDWTDADQETCAGDSDLLAVAADGIAALNRRYAAGVAGPRFILLHRYRVFNEPDQLWMGWERKRGKLHELNRLLRGATDTTFIMDDSQQAKDSGFQFVPADVRYVIALDADTQLPRNTAARLIGKMAHPLNRPVFSSSEQRVIDGYAILQPRITPSLPTGNDGSYFQRVFSSPGGIDPYAAAISDVYQDLFEEGSFTGKGIYDVDIFEASLAGRIPDNSVLSHDLFEGTFARAGLATDVEFIEDFPARYDVAGKRQHRWTRGDWQLLPWIMGRVAEEQSLPSVGRWKMIDNLRRALLAPSTLAALILCLLLPVPGNFVGVGLVIIAIAAPNFLTGLFSLLPDRSGICLGHHLRSLVSDFNRACAHSLLNLIFLSDTAWRMGDAIIRTLSRVFFTRRRLLEWTTAAQTNSCPRPNYLGFYKQMAGGVFLAFFLTLVVIALAPAGWPLTVTFGLLWLVAPALALKVSLPPKDEGHPKSSAEDRHYLRLTARRTWRYFESFVTPEENMLPPDNYQIDPTPRVASRTSPTNIGLYLLSVVSARDFGWIGTSRAIDRLEATIASMEALPKHRGHFFNWYSTRDLAILQPAYVSSVDSGNLAAHLIVLANACEQWATNGGASTIRLGINDHLYLAREALEALPDANGAQGRQISARLGQLEDLLNGPLTMEELCPLVKRHGENILIAIHGLTFNGEDAAEFQYWIESLCHAAEEHEYDRLLSVSQTLDLQHRASTLAATARAMAMDMDFKFLLDPDRKLLSIGFSLTDHILDPSCYDLLASEARLASLFAIAKGDVPTRHWFHLGRTSKPLGNGSALLSWSGSMFEYLMPSLVLRAPAGSLLEQTNRLIVARQQDYAHKIGIPWGISESAYNVRDLEMTIQYSNFGIPGLGLKRGLGEDRVIAPYATALAAMVDPHGARLNYERLSLVGAKGRYGFYEAVDFTPSRVPEGETCALVRSFMAHHQGMTIVAIANVIHGDQMRARFHHEPMIKATELLLQERVPRDIAVIQPPTEDVHASVVEDESKERSLRRSSGSTDAPPVTHLLSNGHYTVMLTAAGTGYSRWHNIALTRWREDSTVDGDGSFIMLRDLDSGNIWSACAQPLGGSTELDEVLFEEDRAEYQRQDGNLLTTMEVVVSGEDDGEVRQISLTNNDSLPRDIELTSYMELVLTAADTDQAHPAFAKLFVQTEYLDEFGALVATRRPRSPDEPRVWIAHFAVMEGDALAPPEYESDRAQFLGRGNSLPSAAALTSGQKLSDTLGTVLDPVFALRHRVTVPSGEVVRIAFWTVVADSREGLIELIDKHHDHSAFDRARTLAWTLAQVQLFDLNISATDAATYQQLAAPIIYSDARFRPLSKTIEQGAASQANLWPQSISGDLPIVLLRISDITEINHVRDLIRAHDYWRIKRIDVDLVIINERTSSYVQDLQNLIDSAVRSSRLRPREQQNFGRGTIYALRADLLTGSVRELLHASARVVLHAKDGSILDQLAMRLTPPSIKVAKSAPKLLVSVPTAVPTVIPKTLDLEFYNGIGGFAEDGREYVTLLDAGVSTPAPWINVIANSGFGFQVSAEGSGYTWAENSRENQLTPWSNDPVSDPCGEVIYVQDDESLAITTATANPIRDSGRYIARHGFGYSCFSHKTKGIELELLQYVPLTDPIKISRLKLTNHSKRPRHLTVTGYIEWVMSASRARSAAFISTEIDPSTRALFAHNPWSIGFPGRVSFADMAGKQSAWTGDRLEFLGHHGSLSAPTALERNIPLSDRTGAALDPCAALQQKVSIEPGETVEVVFFLGQCATASLTREVLRRYRSSDLDLVLAEVKAHWKNVLGAVHVKTPERAMDIMLNGWLLYQTLACRIQARAAFYQVSGAYGFRDQLQDGMALLLARPQDTRAHILRAASRQFPEGDVQHWWLPHSGQGVRTRISDDRVWLAFVTASYVKSSGDHAILEQKIPFLEGPDLSAGEHDSFFQPMFSDESASLFEHCARGLDQSLSLLGERGLPLMGSGDWNDGMNRVGGDGRGESVWLGWLLIRTLDMFIPLAIELDVNRAERWRVAAAKLRESIEREAWDGAWYRRASYDNGTWLGSSENEECRIDSIAQSWAVLSGAADPERAKQAMASMDELLVRPDDGLALLFTPPFDKTSRNPGYIKGYPPGLRENGGQYSHAAMWIIQAYAQLGDGEKAVQLFNMLNPINHARTPEEVTRYKVEPYVIAADVYSVAPHIGRGGWTWYTGSAGLMYRAGVESILGIRREGDFLVISPCIPESWHGFEAKLEVHDTRYSIRVDNSSDVGTVKLSAVLDDKPLTLKDSVLSVPLDGATHKLLVTRYRQG